MPKTPYKEELAVRRGKAKEVTLADVQPILQAEDKQTLIRMMLDWAQQDDRLRERLVLYAARRSGPESHANAALRAFENAVQVDDFVPYEQVPGWARGVDEAIDVIEGLLRDGQSAAVIGLCESALRSLVEAIEMVDDSAGHFSELRDRLENIHYRACQAGRPDPAQLAERLFQFELRNDFDVFYEAASRYAKILGTKGLKVYRELAEAAWRNVPARSAQDERSDWGKHAAITHIMESLAQLSGDVEQQVAVMSRDLSHAYSYLRIAEVYRAAGQHDPALQWAEKGLKAFPQHTDSRLREFAAEEYHRRRRHDDALQLMWAEFCEQPYLESYQTLERHAKKAHAWPQWRERALAEIRSRTAKARSHNQLSRVGPNADHSRLVEIFLYEGDEEAAWREAEAGGCSDGLWLRLAQAREKKHPEEAAPIYL
jgi:tetratricopeptide (TPR) repeat protein